MQTLILCLQAPLMSFGGPQVDQIGPTGRFPTMSQITGLLANALGYAHGDFDRLQVLQERLSIASALVREGEELQDYQTVDLGQAHLRNPSWTTRGRPEHRSGGPDARYGTHIRFRRYRADASVLSAVSLAPAEEVPTLSEVGDALMNARAATVYWTQAVPAFDSAVRRHYRGCRQPHRCTDACSGDLPGSMAGNSGPGWRHRGPGRVAGS